MKLCLIMLIASILISLFVVGISFSRYYKTIKKVKYKKWQKFENAIELDCIKDKKKFRSEN